MQVHATVQLAVVHITHLVLKNIPESAASTTDVVLRVSCTDLLAVHCPDIAKTSVVTLECPRCMWAGAVASLPSVVTSRERPCSPPARRVTSHVHPLRRRGAEPAGSAIGDRVQGKHEPRRRFGVQPWGSNEGGGLGPVLPDSTGTRACTMEWTRHVKETAREIREIRPARARGNMAQERSGRASQVHQTCAFVEPRARTEVVEPVSSQTQPACAERRSALDVHISWGSP
ncbi:hypothetical protein B0H19DRAFT_1272813 [Mycena capillaripes]|nr:hypothetical protein B0H19DRAFT_1272813 [Mycena capillaripes]